MKRLADRLYDVIDELDEGDAKVAANGIVNLLIPANNNPSHGVMQGRVYNGAKTAPVIRGLFQVMCIALHLTGVSRDEIIKAAEAAIMMSEEAQ